MKLSTPMSWTPIALWVTLVLAALPSHANILGVAADFVYSINETTAIDVLLNSNVGVGSQSGAMAKDSAGVLYVAGNATSPNNRLSTVNPVTGVITPGPQISLSTGPAVQIRGLAFNSADVLYAINGNPTSTPPFQLHTINTTTGVGTFVGFVSGVIQALEFDPSGTLYGWDVTNDPNGLGLVTINPVTGAITDVNAAVGGTAAEVQTLAFSPGGALYGARSSLYTINLTTGALTLVGALNPVINIFGMEFISAAPPGPAVSLTPASLAFGNQQVATTSAAQTLTLQNVGTAVLNIASITASGDFAQTNACGSTLAATASCTISVTFTPTAVGARSGSVSVASNAAGSPHSSNLGGTGVAVPPPPPPPGTPAAPVPTLTVWALLMLMAVAVTFGMVRLRRRH